MELLNDAKIRNLLLNELKSKYEGRKDTRIINELGLDFGASRVDVAVVNGIMHGYEIKSDLDTLIRLPRQIEYYNKAFERMTIVVSRKFVEEVKEIIPSWWGIKTVSKDNTRLISIRKGRRVSQQDPTLIIKLLWKKELEGLIDYLGYPKSYKKMRKKQLLSFLQEEADFSVIKEFVYNTLKIRDNWRLE
ncbi:sce7726 family protein [Niallia sp. MER TA 168]|uniref:sce7726 family protein n=1 Tax=Niallia sp. MER TA 168 TaxID=2939568 RepID=UPI00204143FB|nr:sce7726 family protein [Niallia sp. MER TA 168]MCM3363173.1 sce7726 family protein [Niallia sp. MER TA 168]